MAIGKVILAIEAQHAKFTQSVDESKVQLEYFRQKVKNTKEEVTGLRGVLDSLKSGAGKGSTLDELGKTLKGAGAVAGIALLGEAVNKAAASAEKLNEDFRRGKADAAGMAAEFGKSLPVIGGFVSAGQSIREMFTHEKEQIDDITKSAELGNQMMEARVKLVRDTQKAVQDLNREAQQANDRVTAMLLKGEDRKKFEVQVQFKAQFQQLKDEVDNKVADVAASAKPAIDATMKQLSDLRTRISNTTAGTDAYKALKDNIQDLGQKLTVLNGKVDQSKKEIRAAGEQTAEALQRGYQAAQNAPLIDYFDKLREKVDALSVDPVTKMTAEVKAMGGGVRDVQAALELMNKADAAEQYKKNAEGLKTWSKQLKETAAKIQALQNGADEKAAEAYAKYAAGDGAQAMQAQYLAQVESAQDAVLKKMEDQKKVTEEIGKLQTDVATFGLDAAGKTLAEMKGASAQQVAQVQSLQAQLTLLEQQKKVKADIADMEKELAQVNMTEAQKKFDDLQRTHATGDQLAMAKHLADQTDAARAQAKLLEEGKKLMEESVTPLEKYGQEIAHLDELLAAKAIDQKTYDEQAAKDFKELHKHDAADVTSKHAERVERRFDFRLPLQRQEANGPEALALKEHKKANGHLATISKKVGDKPKVASI